MPVSPPTVPLLGSTTREPRPLRHACSAHQKSAKWRLGALLWREIERLPRLRQRSKAATEASQFMVAGVGSSFAPARLRETEDLGVGNAAGRASRTRVLSVLAFLLLLVSGSAAHAGSRVTSLFPNPPASAPPTIAFDTDQVRVSGMTPGAPVALVTLWLKRMPELWSNIEGHKWGSVDDDEDGALQFDIGEPIPALSVWAAIDGPTGGIVVAVPDRFRLHEIEASGRRVLQGARRLRVWRRRLDIVWVRPDQGIWFLRAKDGRADDEDGVQNGRIEAFTERFHPLFPRFGPPPASFAPEDSFVGIDLDRFQFFLLRLES